MWMLCIGRALPEPGMLLLSFAKLAVPPSGSLPARMSLLGVMQGLAWSVAMVPSSVASHDYYSLFCRILQVRSCHEGSFTSVKRRCCLPTSSSSMDAKVLRTTLISWRQLLTSVLAEAEMCCSGQPVMLVGDFNVDPLVIPSLANGMGPGLM